MHVILGYYFTNKTTNFLTVKRAPWLKLNFKNVLKSTLKNIKRRLRLNIHLKKIKPYLV